MLIIENKHDCCGCSACEQSCPKQCISLKKDEEGFLYPQVASEICIECGLCLKVCPVLNPAEKKRPLKSLAAINNNDVVRSLSSSGGVFSALAESVVGEGGRVYGACFNEELAVEHCGTSEIESLSKFRGSKYLQSVMNDTFRSVRSDLNKGLTVLFSGAPCQVAGLKRFLRKNYTNLITVDFVCHGIPSPSVWKGYLESFSDARICAASFRDKESGWHRFGVFTGDPYMQVFLADLSLRPSCYKCASKGGRSGSDLTLGDFWGIEKIDPEIDDDKGINLLLVNSTKGEALLNNLDITLKSEPFDKALEYNPSIEKSVAEPAARADFFRMFIRHGFTAAYKAAMVPSLPRRFFVMAKKLIGKLIGAGGVKFVKSLCRQ